jgi:DNA-binding beta-propeller fold protein YncE
MTQSLLDTFARALGADSTRRGMLQGLSGLTLAGGMARLGLLEAAAKKRGKKRKGKKRKGRRGGNEGGDGGNGGGGSGGGGSNCPLATCEGQCVDLETDPANCGACGARCDDDQICVGGRCAIAIGERGAGEFQFDGPRGLAFDANGFAVLADGNNERIARFSDDGEFATFGESGDGDGQFLRPRGVAINATTGDIYVTDIQRHCIQRFSSAGDFEATFGFFGNGPEQLNFPNGVAIDQTSGNVYILNTGNELIKELNANLFPLRDLPLVGGAGNFNSPLGIAVDRDRNLVVADTGNNRVVTLDRNGNFIRAFGQAGSGKGELDTPTGVAVNSEGIFVVDQGNNRIQQFSSSGQFLATFGRAGTGIGEFDAPFGIAIDGDVVIGIADTGNNRVQFFVPGANGIPASEEGGRNGPRRDSKGRSNTSKSRHTRKSRHRSR